MPAAERSEWPLRKKSAFCAELHLRTFASRLPEVSKQPSKCAICLRPVRILWGLVQESGSCRNCSIPGLRFQDSILTIRGLDVREHNPHNHAAIICLIVLDKM